METLPEDRDPPPPPAAVAYPGWVLLEESARCDLDPDPKTAACSRVSDGRPIRVSFAFAPPPALSRLRADIPGVSDGSRISTLVLATHRDSFLLRINTWDAADDKRRTSDHFVYSAGGDSSRPSPSRALLPPFDPLLLGIQGVLLSLFNGDEVHDAPAGPRRRRGAAGGGGAGLHLRQE